LAPVRNRALRAGGVVDMPLLGDPWASKEGPWASTDHIPGKTGSTVYDRDGLEWVRDTSEMISWGCPARGIRSDHGAVFGPFTAEPPPAPDYIYNSGPYPRPTTERKEDMATSLTADRKALKAQAAELARQLAEVQKGLENLVPDEPAGAGRRRPVQEVPAGLHLRGDPRR
jgi:hypothetical protein